jgi:hypothetical protein
MMPVVHVDISEFFRKHIGMSPRAYRQSKRVPVED